MIVGGGFKAIKSVFRYGMAIGPINLWRTLRSKNACKACAFGTGGQNGGLYNESRSGIQICNKNIQAHLSDIRPGIANTLFLEKSIDTLAQLSGKELEDLGRLATPLYKAAGDSHFRPIQYDDAIAICVEKCKACKPERSFFYASGRSSNEAAFLLQLMARLYGTNNINNCSYYCHQASGVALGESLGTGTATIEYADIAKSDLMFVFGANPASNHPRFLKTLIDLRRRGGKVVVVNPAKEAGMQRFASPSDLRSMLSGGVDIASEYIQPHLGGDIAFIQGLAKAVLALGAESKEFLAEHSEDSEVFIGGVQALSWESICDACGVEQQDIERVAKIYSESTHTIFSWSMGLTHHHHGVQNIQSLVSLALLRGMIGREGAGLLPLRGHSNIQGTGSMGFTPALKKAVEDKLEQKLGSELPKKAGLDTMSCMHASYQGDMDMAFLLGGNLLASNPNTDYAREALNRIPFKVFLNTTLNMSHVQGVDAEVIVLPVRARDEEAEATTQESMFNFVRLSSGGVSRFQQLWPETKIISAIAQKLIPATRFNFSMFSSHRGLREFIADVVPGFSALSEIDESKHEFHIEGRIFHKANFATASGKARLHFHPFKARSESEFVLSSVRSEGQFNSIVFHNYDSYRGQTERRIVMMNPKDIDRRGWKENDLVDISTDVGTMRAVKLRSFDVKPGNILAYYPEVNCIIPNAVDPISQTPSFKSIEVRVAVSI